MVTEAVGRIPDVDYVRREIARNVRERELLAKLLKLAERKAALLELERDADRRAERQAVSHV
jgi:cob(I)alamin adenosyltransferase